MDRSADAIVIAEEDERALRAPPAWLLPAVAGALLAAVVTGALLLWQAWPQTPGDGSADAGFLRDMVVHHDQATTMALIIRDRSEDDLLHTIATDILLTQTSQTGMMRGWLDLWDLHLVGEEPRMSWMGHPVEGLMPGMATPDEIQQLRELPAEEAEVLFCRLMIRHHAAGIEMAQAALGRVDNGEVTRLAEAVIQGQFTEIRDLQGILAERGQVSEAIAGDMDAMAGHPMGTPVMTPAD